MKSNGFTLIELLAIIVILAIIAVITVPIILNIIDNSKKGAISNSAYGYKDAVNRWYLDKLSIDRNFMLNGTYKVRNGRFDGQDVSISGESPSRGLLTYENNVITSGCLQFDEYNVEFEDGKVKNVNKGNCLGVPFVDSDNNGTLSRYDILSIGNEQFYVLESENSNGIITLLARTCLKEDVNTYRQVKLPGNGESAYVNCIMTKFSSSPYWGTSGQIKSDYAYDVNNVSLNYSDSSYPYVYYTKGSDTNYISSIIDAYSATLSTNAHGRLLSYEEAYDLDNDVRAIDDSLLSDSISYWLGSVYDAQHVWNVVYHAINSNSYNSSNYSSNKKIRPVIEIPVADL